MKKTKFIYILLCFIMFFCFSSRVYAETFRCIYPLDTPDGKLSVMIIQKDQNQPVYKFSNTGSEDPEDSSWKKFGGSYNAEFRGGNTNNPYSQCPVYATYYKNEFKTSKSIIFSNEIINTDSVGGQVFKPNQIVGYNDSPNKKETDDIKLIVESSANIDTCEKLFGKYDEEKGEIETDVELINLLKSLLTIIRILVPIIIIGMGILDMVRGIFATDEQQMKKAQSKFMKRLIIGVAFFMIPSVLKVLLTIGSKAWPDVISSDFCGIL